MARTMPEPKLFWNCGGVLVLSPFRVRRSTSVSLSIGSGNHERLSFLQACLPLHLPGLIFRRVRPASLTLQIMECIFSTMRYTVKEEKYKHGRKTETQYAIWDSHKNESVARFATRKEAQKIIDNYEAAQAAAEDK